VLGVGAGYLVLHFAAGDAVVAADCFQDLIAGGSGGGAEEGVVLLSVGHDWVATDAMIAANSSVAPCCVPVWRASPSLGLTCCDADLLLDGLLSRHCCIAFSLILRWIDTDLPLQKHLSTKSIRKGDLKICKYP